MLVLEVARILTRLMTPELKLVLRNCVLPSGLYFCQLLVEGFVAFCWAIALVSSCGFFSTQKVFFFFYSLDSGCCEGRCSTGGTCSLSDWLQLFCTLRLVWQSCMKRMSSLTDCELLGSRYLLFSMLRICWCSLRTRVMNFYSSAVSFWQNLIMRFWRMQRRESMQWSQDYYWKRVAKPEYIDMGDKQIQDCVSRLGFLEMGIQQMQGVEYLVRFGQKLVGQGGFTGFGLLDCWVGTDLNSTELKNPSNSSNMIFCCIVIIRS